jgi:multidrug efflux pump subunit AcrB
MMMKVQDQPDIEFPMVIVSIFATGRRPDRDREPDHQKIEASVRTIAGWTRSRQQRRKAS